MTDPIAALLGCCPCRIEPLYCAEGKPPGCKCGAIRPKKAPTCIHPIHAAIRAVEDHYGDYCKYGGGWEDGYYKARREEMVRWEKLLATCFPLTTPQTAVEINMWQDGVRAVKQEARRILSKLKPESEAK